MAKDKTVKLDRSVRYKTKEGFQWAYPGIRKLPADVADDAVKAKAGVYYDEAKAFREALGVPGDADNSGGGADPGAGTGSTDPNAGAGTGEGAGAGDPGKEGADANK